MVARQENLLFASFLVGVYYGLVLQPPFHKQAQTQYNGDTGGMYGDTDEEWEIFLFFWFFTKTF